MLTTILKAKLLEVLLVYLEEGHNINESIHLGLEDLGTADLLEDDTYKRLVAWATQHSHEIIALDRQLQQEHTKRLFDVASDMD